MGFLDDLGIKQEQIQEAGFKLPPEGRHRFVIGDSKVQKGTKNKPGELAYIISYQLSDADGEPTGKTDERWVMKQDGKVTPRAQESLGYAELRLKQLGFAGGFSDPEFSVDAPVGIRGTLEIIHQTQGDRKFANVRNVEVDDNDASEDDESNEFAEEPAEEAPAKPKRGRPAKQPVDNPAADNGDLWSED